MASISAIKLVKVVAMLQDTKRKLMIIIYCKNDSKAVSKEEQYLLKKHN